MFPIIQNRWNKETLYTTLQKYLKEKTSLSGYFGSLQTVDNVQSPHASQIEVLITCFDSQDLRTTNVRTHVSIFDYK